MPSCVIKHCKSSSQKEKKEDGVSFHRLPADYVLRDKWMYIIRQSRKDSEWRPSKFSVVCSLHFLEDDYYFTEKGRRLIKKTSKPTRNLSPQMSGSDEDAPSPKTSEDQAGPSNLLQNNDVSIKSEPDVEDKSIPGAEEPEIRDSDLESLFDTPTEYRLRKDLRKHKLLRCRATLKIRTLQQNVRRLNKRNTKLKNILKEKQFTPCDTKIINENVVATELYRNLCLRSTGKKTPIKYSMAFRDFCLKLNSYSPTGYAFVRKTFNGCLLHPKSLAKYSRGSRDCPEKITDSVANEYNLKI